MDRTLGATLGLVSVALVLAGCTSTPPRPSSAVSPTASEASAPTTPAAPATTTPPAPAPAPSATAAPPTPAPGEPCDPADGSPDCTNATGDGAFRYVEGYADCVATFGPEEAYSLCTDLEGDGRAGYPDSG